MAMRVAFWFKNYVKLGCGNAAAAGFFDLELSACVKALERFDEGIGRCACVDKSADGHVATDAGEGVKVSNSHTLIIEVRTCLLAHSHPGFGWMSERKAGGKDRLQCGRSVGSKGGEMSHFTANPGLKFSIEVQLDVGKRAGGSPIWLNHIVIPKAIVKPNVTQDICHSSRAKQPG